MNIKTLKHIISQMSDTQFVNWLELQQMGEAYEEQQRQESITRNSEWKSLFQRLELDGK